MKLSEKLLLSAQLVTVVVGYRNPTAPYASRFTNFTDFIEGDEALAYLFNYDPSEPHYIDFVDPETGYPTVEYGDPTPSENPRYDTNYIARICSPRISTSEADEGIEYQCPKEMSREECNEFFYSYDFKLDYGRKVYASSPYPCERLNWIEQECGVNVLGFRGNNESTIHKGTYAEHSQCLCKSDYFAALQACSDCHHLHVGNATLKEVDQKFLSLYSVSLCSEAPTATKVIWDYKSSVWESVHPGFTNTRNAYDYLTTIVSDGAQNKTAWSFYMTESVDFVPATIQEPAFTRTMDGKEVVMTPGVMKGNAKTRGGFAPAGTEVTPTGDAAAAETSKAGAAHVKVSGGLVAAVFGGLMMLQVKAWEM